jgi:hypothetical protein
MVSLIASSAEQQDAGCLISALTFATDAFEQQESAHLSCEADSLTDVPSEQHGCEHLPLTGGSVAGLSFEQQEPAQASVEGFFTDLALSAKLFRRRRRL